MATALLTAACLLAAAAPVLGLREDKSEAELQGGSGFSAAEEEALSALGAAAVHAVHSSAGGAGLAERGSALAADAAGRLAAARSPSRAPTGRCAQDSQGERVGCKVSCDCMWFERCYPKLLKAETEPTDVGVCNPAVALLVAVSLTIIGVSLVCIVALRLGFQRQERIKDLMNTDRDSRKKGLNEEDEQVSADASTEPSTNGDFARADEKSGDVVQPVAS